MEKLGKLIYSGKAKSVYEYKDEDKVVVSFRDDITAGDGEKKDSLSKKGYYNTLISTKLFEILEENGIATQLVKLIDSSSMVSKKLEMIPLEVIARNLATGSLIRRFPFEEKTPFNPPIIQFDFKNDEFHDPMLNDDIAIALKIATKEDLAEIREITLKINEVLSKFLDENGILLVDFKLEFGKDNNGNIILGDEISPDTCRFWDNKTHETLDKDLFRKGEGDVMSAYHEIFNRIISNEDIKRWSIDSN
ncbi:MAG: phosphoribosylaminoimidazolesuccinocarboxamide synthase [Methanobrevibacter sp.]|jgi:phosphoribosylaminoimidazole-succinocarboxamide synthase|nr:phosphoribosylaminoimidazolesuccinocarboxamide synthase [Candidatus Methanoflexus mossambicus]